MYLSEKSLVVMRVLQFLNHHISFSSTTIVRLASCEFVLVQSLSCIASCLQGQKSVSLMLLNWQIDADT
jgi:hypothetical protein